jgi:hypothetical protein
MNRWQAITEIVRLFLVHKRPGYAIVALMILLSMTLAMLELICLAGEGIIKAAPLLPAIL